MQKRTYIVFRIGSNGANQPSQHEMAIAKVDATNRQKAWIIACNQHNTKCYSNQKIEVRSRRSVPQAIITDLDERLALQEAQQ